MDNSPLREFDWNVALRSWGLVVLAAIGVGFVLSVLLSAAARGSIIDGLIAAVMRVKEFVSDVFALSPRRLWAITWHSILESIRRRMLLAVLAVFVVLFMFAGWYLPGRSTHQVTVYVSFVMLAATVIVVVASTLLACLGLPSDIHDRTIHTVVTKPVRRLEIVLGRIFGLTLVATIVLALMGTGSYFFLNRSISGSLDVFREQLAAAKAGGDKLLIAKLQDDVDQIESKLIARVPIFADELEGPEKSVGEEMAYRKYIEGNKIEAAVWHFKGLPVDKILAGKPAALPLEMTFAVFRTTKGDIGHGVVAQITYRNGRNRENFITTYPFEVREYYVNKQVLHDTPERSLKSLFDGSNGDIDVEVRCMSQTQYLGMARPDVYVLLETASFGANFAKGMLGVWTRVVLIICVAVMFSTFLNTFVALLATAAVFMGGISMPYLKELAAETAPGGGPISALMRLVMHENLQSEFDSNMWTKMAGGTDKGMSYFLTGLVHILPDLGFFNTAPLVANGFDITGALLLQTTLAMLAYAVPFTILGYFLLQSREIAR